MDTGFFDVFHDAADDDVGAVGESVHVHFDGVFQETINQDGAGRAHEGGLGDVVLNGLQIVGGALQSLDGFAVNSDNAAVVTDHSSNPLPGISGPVMAPADLGGKLDWLQSMAAIEGAALMWLALSTMAHTSMREMKDAKDIKHALQKGKLAAKDAEIQSEQNQIDANREAAAQAFAVALVAAVVSACFIQFGGDKWSSFGGSAGSA